MAKAKWGNKRICSNCGAKYYDFDKETVECPSCGTAFDAEVFMRGRRTRAATILPAADITPDSGVEPIKDLTEAPVLTPVEGVDEPEPLDADTPDAPAADVPEDLDLGPEFDDGNTTAADDDSLLDDDDLGDDGLPPVAGVGGDDGDDEV